jgi:putative transposase
MAPWKVSSDVNLHFLTTTVVQWQPVFVSRTRCDLIIDSLKHCIALKGLHLHGYVIMPTHAHYMLSTNPGICLSDVMRDFNTHTSRGITESLTMEKEVSLLRIFREAAIDDGRGNNFKVWQTGFHPISIETDRFFWEKLEYIHNNPVRKGLVERPEEWEYSSARNYILGDHTIIQVEFLQ